MKKQVIFLAASAAIGLSAAAQPSGFQDDLLDHLTGRWVLRGTIDGQETIHDISASWILGHEYLRLYEVSREKDPGGRPAYEAVVMIGWDARSAEYVCLWLDTTTGDGIAAQTLGRAKRGDGEIAFLFKSADGTLFHTTFAYDRNAGSWRWLMDGERGGKLIPFARVRLTRG